jgi:hypothetical protein
MSQRLFEGALYGFSQREPAFTPLPPALLWDISQENQEALKAKSARRQSL